MPTIAHQDSESYPSLFEKLSAKYNYSSFLSLPQPSAPLFATLPARRHVHYLTYVGDALPPPIIHDALHERDQRDGDCMNREEHVVDLNRAGTPLMQICIRGLDLESR